MQGTTPLCPWCGKPLEAGSFMSRGGNYFLPRGAQKPHAYTQAAMEKRGAILLPPHFLSSAPVENPAALACRQCKKIIIPYQ